MGRTAWILAAALLLGSAAADAQITLYEHDNFGGSRLDLYADTPDLANSGFNDTASSAIVHGGSWLLCEHGGFGGRCVTLAPGNYPALANFGLNDLVSSLRPVGGVPGRPAPLPAPVGGPTGGRIVLYEGVNFSGRAVTVDRDMLNLDRVGLNDLAQSAIVYDGNWMLCEHAEFQGDCQVFGPGRYPNLGNLSRRVSSLRAGAGYAPPPVAPPAYAPGAGGAPRVVLYEGQNFSGRQLVVDRNRFANLDGTGFNDRASSLRVERGYWMFCSDLNFEGDCRTFGPGEYPSLPSNLNNRISSGRRISDDYPYSQPPNWGGSPGSGYTQQ